MHYYQFNIGNYARRTKHLDPIEDLAYRRLLDLYYLNEKPFDSSPDEMAREIGLKQYPDEVSYVLHKFFPDGTNAHADEEIRKYHAKSLKAKASAEARWNKEESKGNANAMRTHTEGNANQEPITNNQEPIKDNIGDKSPIDPQLVVDEWNIAFKGCYPRQKRIVTPELRKMIIARHKEGFEELADWVDMFGYIKQSDFLMGNVHSGNRKPFQLSLEWLVKKQNMIKLIEGAYHG